MNSDRYIPTDTTPIPLDEQLAALILKRAPGATIYKRALDALRTLQERNRLLMREREGAREDAAKYQRLAAELSDKLNGTPCAQIRWMQEREELHALLREVAGYISSNDELCARIDATLKGGGDE